MQKPEFEKRESENPNWRVDIEVDERSFAPPFERQSVHEVPLRSPASENESAESNWDVLGRALKSLFESNMVRLVGPNERPLERHEFEAFPSLHQSQWRNKF